MRKCTSLTFHGSFVIKILNSKGAAPLGYLIVSHESFSDALLRVVHQVGYADVRPPLNRERIHIIISRHLSLRHRRLRTPILLSSFHFSKREIHHSGHFRVNFRASFQDKAHWVWRLILHFNLINRLALGLPIKIVNPIEYSRHVWV